MLRAQRVYLSHVYLSLRKINERSEFSYRIKKLKDTALINLNDTLKISIKLLTIDKIKV